MDGKLESDRESNGVYRQRSRSRSRSPVDHPKSHNFRDGKRSQGGPVPKRVYVTNIPYNCRWSDLKDLFRDKVGDVAYVDLFEDEAGRFKGNGIVEFNNAESVQKAIDVLNKFEYKGRPLYVKEDTIGDRVRGGGPGPMRGGGGGPMPRGMPPKYNPPMPSGGGGGPPPANFNTYGLSPKFLEYLGITGPLVSKVFVTNLSYRVDEAKLRDVFSIAGKVMRVDIKKDKDGQSKGLALVEFDHPVEAVQAISMFHDQKLFNRPMSIRMDRFVGNDNEPPKLPSGLSGIGKGLGTSGQPLQIPKEPGMNTGYPVIGGGGGGSGGLGPSSMNMMAGNMGMNAPMSMMNSGGGMGGMPSSMGMGTPAAGGMGSMGMGNSSMLGGAASSGYSSGLAPNSSMAAPSPGMGLGMAPASSSAMGYGNDRYDGGRGGGLGNDSFSSGQSDTVLLRNLPTTVTWQMLKDRFRDVGDIRHVDLKGRGMAVMRFGSERDARRAVDLMHGLRVDGRPIEVTLYN